MNRWSALTHRLVPGTVAVLITLAAFASVATSAAPVTLSDAQVSQGAGETSFDVAPTVWFQGFLADAATGDPVNATYAIVASIYNHESGGSLLWGPETHSYVPIVEGWFNIELGSVTPPLPDFASTACYLQLRVNGELLMPRSKLASVPTAIQAGDDGDWFMDGDDIYHETGFVNIGTGPLGEARDDRASGLNVVGTAQVTGFKLPTGAAAGRVLTSDASGTGTWQTLPGGIGGGGSAGYLTKFTGAATVGNSAAYESGGNIAIGTTTTSDARLTVETATALPALALKTTTSADGARALHLSRTQSTSGNDDMLLMDAPSTSTYGTWIRCRMLTGGGFYTPFMVTTDGSIFSIGSSIFENSSQYAPVRAYNYYASNDAKAIDAHHESSPPSDGVAVYGESVSADYYGYGGRFVGGYKGVQGEVTATGSASYFGACGSATATGGTGNCYGLYGSATNGGANYGVYGYAAGGATNWAGYFDGNVRVTGSLNPLLARLEVDDPTDPANGYLRHPFVASDEMKTVYDGTVVLDARGEATVEMPDWFEALNGEFRYQLTAVGAPGPNLYIADEVRGGAFRIAGGEPGMKVCWQVTGVRHDAVAARAASDVRVPKSAEDRGRYLDPVAHGAPEDLRIGRVVEKTAD
jgi:hypothetical protein